MSSCKLQGVRVVLSYRRYCIKGCVALPCCSMFIYWICTGTRKRIALRLHSNYLAVLQGGNSKQWPFCISKSTHYKGIYYSYIDIYTSLQRLRIRMMQVFSFLLEAGQDHLCQKQGIRWNYIFLKPCSLKKGFFYPKRGFLTLNEYDSSTQKDVKDGPRISPGGAWSHPGLVGVSARGACYEIH